MVEVFYTTYKKIGASEEVNNFYTVWRMENETPFRPSSTRPRFTTPTSDESHSRRVLAELNKQDARLKEMELKGRQNNCELQKKLDLQEKATSEILKQLKTLQDQFTKSMEKPRRLPSELTVSSTI